MSEFGSVDALVNNAAIYKALGGKRPLTELTNDDWDLVLRVNVRGTWQGIKAVTEPMAASGGGRIVNVSSVVARTGAIGFAHYVASKAAVDGLTRAAARELGPRGITVNAVAPGLVTDEATRALNTDDYIAGAAKGRSIPREMTPDDLVGAVLWLASPAAGFVSGQTIIVDGGQVFA
jgi:NAD(P)-dependent dehydrogenase (short-subunit alcohol dehydrogenase family)